MGEGRPCVGLARVRFHRPVRIRTGGPGLDIDRSAGGETLTRERLREIPLGEIAAVARARITAFWAEFDKGRTPGVRDVRPIPAGLSPEVDMRRRGRRGRPDSERAEIAEAYVQCCVKIPLSRWSCSRRERNWIRHNFEGCSTKQSSGAYLSGLVLDARVVISPRRLGR